jgi:phage tail sheath gpL-like
MKLANQTLTAKTSGAVAADGEFDISGTVGTQAANIAAAINAMPELSGIVTAVANAGVVTVTSVVPGVVGNGIECADVDLANVSVAGFSGGSDGTSHTLDFE